MELNKTELINQSLFKALKIRNEQNIDLWSPLCIYDLAEKYGLEIFFSPIPSLEGMFSKRNSNVILISSLRPTGRQVYTCAHEFGHFIYNHSFKIDELNSVSKYIDVKEEIIADAFAGFLLMPKTAIQKAFSERNWNLKKISAKEVYIVAKIFGVGYSTLLNHLRNSLRLITYSKYIELKKETPQKIKSNIFNISSSSELVIIDENWYGRPIDLQIGDQILTSTNIIYEGKNLIYQGDHQQFNLYEASKIGIDRLISNKSDWTSFIRISKREYEGRNIYKYLEDEDDD